MLICHNNKIERTFFNLICVNLIVFFSYISIADTTTEFEKTTSNTSSISHPDIDQKNVSFDGFSSFDKNNNPVVGDGKGDLILLIVDEAGKGPRKKSIMIDLNIAVKNSQQNDLTVNDILSLTRSIVYSSQELSQFIKNSNNPEELIWSIYGIANHTSSKKGDLTSLRIINSGIVTTQPTLPDTSISYSDIHNIQALITDLIKNNINYGIQENQSFISFFGEESFFLKKRYGYIASGVPSFGKLNEELILGMHQKSYSKKELSNARTLGSTYQHIGTASIKRSPESNEYLLLLNPI